MHGDVKILGLGRLNKMYCSTDLKKIKGPNYNAWCLILGLGWLNKKTFHIHYKGKLIF